MSYRPPKKPTLALETDIVQDNIPAEVYPNIYIGSIHAAFNQETLLNLGITHILNASRLPSTFPKTFTYLSIDIRDKDEANILACIPAANIFIEAGIESGGVMVHCYGGRSRSAALVAAFLMSSFEWSYAKSLQTIQAARPVAHINHGFEIQLKAYVHAKYDVYIAQQVLLQGRVRALQCYRSIEGNTADELVIKANERKKFGLLHSVGSNGHTHNRHSSSHNSQNNRPGSKRSWGNAKDEDDIEEHNDSGSSGEDAEEEDNLMESAVKSYHTNHPLDITKESYSSQKTNKTPFSAISSSSSSLLLSTNTTPSHNHNHNFNHNHLNNNNNNNISSPRLQLNGFHNGNGNNNNSISAHILATHDVNSSSLIYNNNNNNTNNNNTLTSQHHIIDNPQHTNSSTRLRQHIPLMDPRSPRLRLSRPGSTTVRVIPPLRGLERVFCCSWCHCQLFNLASVIRTDIRVNPLPDYIDNWASEKDDSTNMHKSCSSSRSSSLSNANINTNISSSSSIITNINTTTTTTNVNMIQASPRGSSKMVAPSLQEKESTYLMPAPSPRGSNLSFSSVPYPDDAKLSSTTYSSPDKFGLTRNNNNYNNNHNNGNSGNLSSRNVGYKSPPKTSRSRSAKTFDFDLLNDESNNFKSSNNNNNNNHNDDETSTLKLVSETPSFHNNYDNINNINNNNSNNNINNNNNDYNNNGNENRVSSPMEISDEKQSSSQNETNLELYSKEVDEKLSYLNESSSPSPSLSLSRRSSKNQFKLQVTSDNSLNRDEQFILSSSPSQYQQQQQQQQFGILGNNLINSSRPGSSSIRQRDNTNSTPLSLSRSSSVQQMQPPPTSPTESPRIIFPHEPRESYAYPSPRNRPQSAEKRRWLERVNLLKSDCSTKDQSNDNSLSLSSSSTTSSGSYGNGRFGKHDEKVTKLSQDDDEAIKLGFGRDKYIYLEYLEWMGEELLSSSIDSGELKCNNCSHTIGSWSWTPNYRQTLNGILQVPVIRVHKNVVHEVDVPLDQTPLSTPRLDDQMEDGNTNI